MARREYSTPVWFGLENNGDETVVGEGTGQGSNAPYMTYEEWWSDIAWGGENPDADYNGDGVVDRADYDYYIENRLWEG